MNPIEVITKEEAKARGWKPLTSKLKRSSKIDNALFTDTVQRVSEDATARLASVEDHRTRQLWRSPHPRQITTATDHKSINHVSAGPTIGWNQRRSK